MSNAVVPSSVAQHVKPQPAMPAYHTAALAGDLASLPLIQLPANEPGKVAGNHPGTCATSMRDLDRVPES